MASIREIAKRAQTSTASVSRVLNNIGYISDDLRLRVQKAIEELEYTPNIAAQELRSKQSRAIGLLIPTLELPIFSILATTIERALAEENYYALICNTLDNPRQEEAYIDTLISHRVSGVIVISSNPDQTYFNKLVKNNIPIIALDRALHGVESMCIRSDHYAGGQMMAQHIIGLGHKDIAVLCPSQSHEPMVVRLQGIRDVLSAANISIASEQIFQWDNYSFEDAYHAAIKALNCERRPTALVCLGDVAAVAAMHAAHELKLSIPSDVSIIGFDDIPLASYVIPGLTTIAQPAEQLGMMSTEHILRMIKNKTCESGLVVLPVSLVVRESTCVCD